MLLVIRSLSQCIETVLDCLHHQHQSFVEQDPSINNNNHSSLSLFINTLFAHDTASSLLLSLLDAHRLLPDVRHAAVVMTLVDNGLRLLQCIQNNIQYINVSIENQLFKKYKIVYKNKLLF